MRINFILELCLWAVQDQVFRFTPHFNYLDLPRPTLLKFNISFKSLDNKYDIFITMGDRNIMYLNNKTVIASMDNLKNNNITILSKYI